MKPGDRLSLLLITLCAGALCSCASLVAEILPIGQPVTAERCRNLDPHELGLKDGDEGQRPGPRFEFWDKDCRAFGVKLDREAYDRGFVEGMQFYCSCDKGFDSGVRDQLTELRGQYYSCKRADYGQFLKGHAAGLQYKTDDDFVTVKGVNSTYNEAAIKSRGVEVCSALPANGQGGGIPEKTRQ